MIYVYPNKPRSKLMTILVWPFLFLQVLWLHPKLGLSYAFEWSNKTFHNEPYLG